MSRSAHSRTHTYIHARGHTNTHTHRYVALALDNLGRIDEAIGLLLVWKYMHAIQCYCIRNLPCMRAYAFNPPPLASTPRCSAYSSFPFLCLAHSASLTTFLSPLPLSCSLSAMYARTREISLWVKFLEDTNVADSNTRLVRHPPPLYIHENIYVCVDIWIHTYLHKYKNI